MVELLVHLTGRGDVNDASDWQPLDVVVVKPNGWKWGARETDGASFFIIKIPDGTEADIAPFLQEEAINLGNHPNLTKRRSNRLSFNNLPPAIRNKVNKLGNGHIRLNNREESVFTISIADFQNVVEVKP